MPVTFWIWSVNIFHDASHFAYSLNWKINELMMNVGFMFCTPYVWYHQHVIAHHSFPNIHGLDPDLYHAPEVSRHSSDLKLRPGHKIQNFTFLVLWLIAVPLGLMLKGID